MDPKRFADQVMAHIIDKINERDAIILAESFDILEIHRHRLDGAGELEFEVEWYGFPNDWTWEPFANLSGCQILEICI